MCAREHETGGPGASGHRAIAIGSRSAENPGRPGGGGEISAQTAPLRSHVSQTSHLRVPAVRPGRGPKCEEAMAMHWDPLMQDASDDERVLTAVSTVVICGRVIACRAVGAALARWFLLYSTHVDHVFSQPTLHRNHDTRPLHAQIRSTSSGGGVVLTPETTVTVAW